MPIRKVDKGKAFTWGYHGAHYSIKKFGVKGARNKAISQMKAAFVHGYEGSKNKHMAWDINAKTQTPLYDYPESFGYSGERKFMNPNTLFKELQKSGEVDKTRFPDINFWSQKMNELPGDTKFKRGNMPELKQAILSQDKKIEPVMAEKKGNNITWFEGRHRLAAAHELGVDVPVIMVSKKKIIYDG